MSFTWLKKNRFYNVYLQPNLFGHVSVICSWGSINSKRGNYKIIHCDDEDHIKITLQSIQKRRIARGYMFIVEQ